MMLIFIDQVLPEHRSKPFAADPQGPTLRPTGADIRYPKSCELFPRRQARLSTAYLTFRDLRGTSGVLPGWCPRRLQRTQVHLSQAKFFVTDGDSVVKEQSRRI